MPFLPDLQTMDINGASIAYHERGAGEPVIFVHGTSQDIRTWQSQVEDFAQHFRTITYSRRYARPNDDIPPGQDDQMLPHVEDLVTLLRKLDAAPAHLVGNSWGGFISLLTAIRHPDAVRSLVLCEPPVLPLFVSNEPKPGEILRLALRGPANAFRIVRFGIGVIQPAAKAYRDGDFDRANRAFGIGVLGKDGLEALPADRWMMVSENSAAAAAQLIGAGFPSLTEDEVKRVTAPSLLLAGERSPAVLRLTFTNALHRLLPNAQRAIIPAASHMMHEDNPAAFNATVIRFLQDVPKPKSAGA
jgi:pimeloyl-ACP methyl ester carboxylesterase